MMLRGSEHLECLQSLVFDEASFIEFLEALSFDKQIEGDHSRHAPFDMYEPSEWKHEDIASYFNASVSSARSSSGDSSLNLQESNPWKRVAEILLAGKDSD